MDDPNLGAIELADIKAWFEVAENRTVHARYWPAKLCRNAMSGSAQNEFDERDEPVPDERISVTEEEGLKLVKKPFAGAPVHIFCQLHPTPARDSISAFMHATFFLRSCTATI